MFISDISLKYAGAFQVPVTWAHPLDSMWLLKEDHLLALPPQGQHHVQVGGVGKRQSCGAPPELPPPRGALKEQCAVSLGIHLVLGSLHLAQPASPLGKSETGAGKVTKCSYLPPKVN